MDQTMDLDQVFEDVGGLGWFQFRHIGVIALIKAWTGWSMMIMSFAGLVPDYYCHTGTHLDPGDTRENSAMVLYANMTAWHGTGNDSFNWDLVCDRKWIKPTITSVQMAGVLAGAVLAGQSGDMFGRRQTNYGFFLLHTLLNVVAGFSTSWQMFLVLRLLIGFCIGGLLVVLVPFMMEFLPIRWRPLVSSVPMWPLGVVLFAAVAWQLEDWAYLHFACALISAPVLLTYFIIPESPRWLAVHGRLKEAYSVVEKMASMNGTVVPAYAMDVIEKISVDAVQSKKGSKKYSYYDILNGAAIAKITIIFGFQWCAISFIFYGLSFGVSSFSGNLYLNIALMSLVELPACVVTFFAVNKLGRRPTTFAYFCIGCVAAFACVAVHYKVHGSHRGTTISALSLMAKMACSASWATTSMWIVESYPTVTRSVGYGFVNMTARIGAIIAPFALDLDYNFGPSYIIIGVLQTICLVLTLLIPETKGKALPDNVNDHGVRGNQSDGKAPQQHTNGLVTEDVDLQKAGNGLDTKLSSVEIKL